MRVAQALATRPGLRFRTDLSTEGVSNCVPPQGHRTRAHLPGQMRERDHTHVFYTVGHGRVPPVLDSRIRILVSASNLDPQVG